MTADSLARLRALRREPQPEPEERCELCGEVLAARHRHLFDPRTRALLCACQGCTLLFQDPQGRYRPVPEEIRYLPDFALDDESWDGLLLPVNLAFFVISSTAGRPLALYPGPAGATESQLGLDTWSALEEANPLLRTLQPDVQALLCNRIGTTRDHFLVPIDVCFELVGLVRLHWRGLGGGPQVWAAIAAFFDELRARGGPRDAGGEAGGA